MRDFVPVLTSNRKGLVYLQYDNIKNRCKLHLNPFTMHVSQIVTETEGQMNYLDIRMKRRNQDLESPLDLGFYNYT